MIYGLLGSGLKHSFSKEIHQTLGGYEYNIFDVAQDALDDFMKERKFSGINVTIPYKEAVIPYLDSIDDRAKELMAVNTIVSTNGRLAGYNTDYYGFEYTIKGLNIAGKKALVLGSGGAAKVVNAVLRNRGASQVICTSESGRAGALPIKEAILKHNDSDIIINATPVGMYPNANCEPISAAELNSFTKCEAVIDIIYNPLRTRLLLHAAQLGMQTADGLGMLVMQAKKAMEIFMGVELDEKITANYLQKLRLQKSNIVLIGMPGAGKSTISRLMATKLNRQIIDIDDEIVNSEGRSIAEIFEANGESYFRDIEERAVREASAHSGVIISTGGGVIKRAENIIQLKQNGILIFIDRPLSAIKAGGKRPLSKDDDAVKKLYSERYEIYKAVADFIVSNDSDAATCVDKIIKEIKLW